MNFNIRNAMKSALHLTQSGRLSDATIEIQKALRSNRTTPDETRKRHSLGETVKALRDLGQRVPQARESEAAKVPDGAEFVTRHFACHAGKRAYKLYVPAQKPRGRRPLIIMLHGCTQNADDFALGTRMNQLAESFGMVVAYPEQTKRANASACWNWFNPADQQRGAGEPAIIAGITKEIAEDHKIDPTRIYVAGLSAGGAMAMVMGASYPEIYAGIGVHSGLPYKAANDVMSALGAMRGGNPSTAGPQPQIRTIIFHGDADKTVHPENAFKIAEAGQKPGKKTTSSGTASVHGGRNYTRTVKLNENGAVAVENWIINGAGHAWAGGSAAGSYTDPKGPDASAEMLRFFLEEETG